MANLGKENRNYGRSIINRIQEMEERVSVIEDMIEEVNTTKMLNLKSS